MATDKRARKKQFRDEKRAALEAAWRRRRLIRLSVVLVVLGTVIALAFIVPGDDSKKPAATKKSESPAGSVACGADPPPPANPKQYDEPEDVLKDGVDYAATIHTSCGDIFVDLLEDEAPITVNNFVFLAKEGFYDGLTWHRIVQNFVIQGGDPKGDGSGGPGYEIKDELPAKSNVYTFGAVAMANSGPDTGGSQFFIVTHRGSNGEFNVPAGLTPDYALFGQVAESSFEVVEDIGKLPTQGGDDPALADRPVQQVFINSIEISES